MSSLSTKPLNSWTTRDHQLNRFLTSVGYYEKRITKQVNKNTKISDKDICEQLKKIDKAKMNLNIENDMLNYEKFILRNQFKKLELKIKEMDSKCKKNRKKYKELIERKHFLNNIKTTRKS